VLTTGTVTESALAIITVSIYIAPNNDAPVFGFVPQTITVAEHTAAGTSILTVPATDVEGDSFRYTLTGDDVALFTFDNLTAALALNFTPDFAAPQDANHDNIYSLRITTSDYNGPVAAGIADLKIVISDVTGMLTAGDGGDNTLTGSALADHISGLAGNDVLIGGAGADFLIGGAGADLFRFESPASGVDVIADFVRGTDHIDIVSSAFDGLDAASSVVVAANAPSGTAPQLVFTNADSTLYYDATGTVNGLNDAVKLAVLTGVATLNGSDIHFS
jgi:Ca2+-binding RTX toxin-like protein